MKTMCPPAYQLNGFVAAHALAHALGHKMHGCRSFMTTYVYIYIYTYIYIYIYIYIYYIYI